MIRIDGSRVRQLREERGLTQLYVATSVDVTTDTISRWENKRYPTIKEENGRRLAEVLEVELDAILDTSPPETQTDSPHSSASGETRAGVPLQLYTQLINIALAVMVAVVIALVYWKKPLQSPSSPHIEAIRFVPGASMPGIAFPVLVEITGGDQTPLLVEERLPLALKVLSTMPRATSAENGIMKWLLKQGADRQRITYLVRAEGAFGDVLQMSGSIKMSKGPEQRVDTGGLHEIRLAPVHWADSNGDYVIDDDEILQVYDHFGSMSEMADELNTVEEMWLGSGYRWNAKGKTIEVLQ